MTHIKRLSNINLQKQKWRKDEENVFFTNTSRDYVKTITQITVENKLYKKNWLSICVGKYNYLVMANLISAYFAYFVVL